jgi:hypothetical protein
MDTLRSWSEISNQDLNFKPTRIAHHIVILNTSVLESVQFCTHVE